MRVKYVLRAGELHGVFAHLRAIGHFICDSGLDDMWTDTDVYGTTVVNQIINCSHMKRSLAAHELNMIVLYTLYLQALGKEVPNTLSMGDLINNILIAERGICKRWH